MAQNALIKVVLCEITERGLKQGGNTMENSKVIEQLEYTKQHMGMPEQGDTWAPNAQTIAIDQAIDALLQIPTVVSNLKHCLGNNEENGIVYMPKFIVEKMITSLETSHMGNRKDGVS